MDVNSSIHEASLTQEAVSCLKDLLPEDWQLEQTVQHPPGGQPHDLTLRLTAPNGMGAAIAVEETRFLSPRSALTFLPPIAQRMRAMSGSVPLLLIAPWLSKRTQKLLADQDVNYLDLTGNSLISLSNPPLFIKTDGASRNPHPQRQGPARLRGPKAGRLIRFLLDVRPPYTASELAKETRLTPGYVSRLLDALYAEALIERPKRGAVEAVDVANLVRRWAESYEVFRSNQTDSWIAPGGPKELLGKLKVSRPEESRFVVSGSFAAAAIAPPVTAPALLVGYCDQPGALARELDLLPSQEGANVILMKPYDPVVWERAPFHGGLTYASPPQVAVDCLTGNGRMPEEGEALLAWMDSHEAAWRAASIDPVDRPA